MGSVCGYEKSQGPCPFRCGVRCQMTGRDRAPEVQTIRESGKIRLELVPAAALREEAKALDAGNRKDGRTPFNWRENRVLASDQAGGALRHITTWLEGEDIDADSLAHHLGAARARLGIILDALAHGMLVDDRVVMRKRKVR